MQLKKYIYIHIKETKGGGNQIELKQKAGCEGGYLAQQLRHSLRCPHRIPQCLGSGSHSALPIQLPASVHPGGQQVMVPILGPLSPSWETRMVFWVPVFSLVQPCLALRDRRLTSFLPLSFSPFLPVSLSLSSSLPMSLSLPFKYK